MSFVDPSSYKVNSANQMVQVYLFVPFAQVFSNVSRSSVGCFDCNVDKIFDLSPGNTDTIAAVHCS